MTKDVEQQESEEEVVARKEENKVAGTVLQKTTKTTSDGDDNDDNDGHNNRKRKRKRKRKRSSHKDKTKEQEGSKEIEKETTTATPAEADDDDDDMEKKKKKYEQDEIDRTVYVEGIPFVATPEQVRQFFIDNGINDVIDMRLPTWHDSGRLRGYGHVVFESSKSYNFAIQKLSGNKSYLLGGRYLTFQPAHNQPKEQSFDNSNSTSAEPSKTIALHNLSYQANEDDIEAVMEQYGTIARGGIRVVRHGGGSQLSKGFAYVQYEDIESAKRVMMMGQKQAPSNDDGTTNASNAPTRIVICGRQCRVDYDHGRVRASFRTADRKLWQNQYGKPTGEERGQR